MIYYDMQTGKYHTGIQTPSYKQIFTLQLQKVEVENADFRRMSMSIVLYLNLLHSNTLDYFMKNVLKWFIY